MIGFFLCRFLQCFYFFFSPFCAVLYFFLVQQVCFIGYHLLMPLSPLLFPWPWPTRCFVPCRLLYCPCSCFFCLSSPGRFVRDSMSIIFWLLLGYSETLYLRTVSDSSVFCVFNVISFLSYSFPLGGDVPLLSLFCY
jgi:hypothetical protein